MLTVETEAVLSYIAGQDLSIFGNCFHFFEVATALARRIYEETHNARNSFDSAADAMFETDDRVFR
jgi:hypothetical protein